MTLPITTTTLTAAATNQVPNMVLASALNIAALQTLFDNANEMYTYLQTFAAPGAIGTTNLADLAVTTAKLAALAVTTAKIALLAVDTAQLADSSVTSAKIANGAIVDADINASAAIAGSKLADNAITTAKITDLNVTTAKIALLAITAAQIADLTITSGKLALLAVGTGQIADSAITSAKIADNAIVDADINGSAAIAWSKISKTSSSLADLATRLASDLTGTLAAAQLPALTGDITMTAGTNTTAIATGVIVDADVNASAAIAWTKLSKSGSNLTDLATRLASDLTGTLAAAQFPALTGDITTTAGALATVLKAVGTAGTYKSVTTDAQGRVTAGTNPTSLSGYGITDAAPLSHVGAGDSAHALATTSQSGFISAADLIAFRALTPTGLGTYAVPVGQIFSEFSRYSEEQDPVTGEKVWYEI